jgi:hypothetical protein
MLRRVALVRTDVSEELSASFIRATRIGELGTTLAVTSNRHTLLVFLRSVRRLLVTASVVPSSCHPDDGGAKFLRDVDSYKSHAANIPEDAILHSHRRENLRFYYLVSRWVEIMSDIRTRGTGDLSVFLKPVIGRC